MGFIYKATCLTSQKSYIGKTAITIQDRWKSHCEAAFLPSHGDYNFPFHRAIRKYGKTDFYLEQLEECENEKLNEREIYWISYYNTFYNGYNATLGGDGNCKYDYDSIVNYYLANNFSIKDTCAYFKIYDQVVYSALKSKNIDYKRLSSQNQKPKTSYKNKKILLVEENIIFLSMKDIDDYFGKTAHPNVRRCLNGITEKAYGYHWKELDIDEEIEGADYY